MKSSIRGFTIVELIVVIVVIGILASIAVGSYSGVVNRANDTARLSEARALENKVKVKKILDGSSTLNSEGYTRQEFIENNDLSDLSEKLVIAGYDAWSAPYKKDKLYLSATNAGVYWSYWSNKEKAWVVQLINSAGDQVQTYSGGDAPMLLL